MKNKYVVSMLCVEILTILHARKTISEDELYNVIEEMARDHNRTAPKNKQINMQKFPDIFRAAVSRLKSLKKMETIFVRV